jgi:putative spermidine/putrescine transport system permease protein
MAAAPVAGDHIAVVAGGGSGTAGPPARPRPAGWQLPAAWRRRAALLGLLPFLGYTVVFLGLPTLSVVVDAFRDDSGHWTLHNLSLASQGVYRTGFIMSLKLSLLTAAISTVAGTLIAQAVLTSRRNTVLRRVVTTASGVFANFGGVPLAFVFIATVGTTGMATRWFHTLGFDLSSTGFSLFSFAGIAVVYSYFLVPLMVLVITPALEGLRPRWREAAENLGASAFSYWRYVALPVLTPALLGSFLLLFGSAFAAYATAAALTSGTVALTPLQIGNLLSGNVLANGANLGKALGFGMIVVISVVMIGYILLSRRAARWLR